MNTTMNQKFAFWLVKQCQHMVVQNCDKGSVQKYVQDPCFDTAARMEYHVAGATMFFMEQGKDSLDLAKQANQVFWLCSDYYDISSQDYDNIDPIVTAAANVLNKSVEDLKFEFVHMLTDDEIKTTDPYWISYVNPEIFKRAQ